MHYLRKILWGIPVFVLSVLVGANEATSATVHYQTGDAQADLSISGQISARDLQKIKDTVSDLNKLGLVVFRVYLNSPDGNVEEAIRIGRYFRDIRVATIAPEKSDDEQFCASACSLIWFGGVYRIGRVLVHRAFFADEQGHLDFNDWDQALSGSRQSIQTYLSQMRVPNWVNDLIDSVPSAYTRAVDAVDIGVFDPVFEDFVASKCGDDLNSDETTILRFLEENEELGLKQDDPVYRTALRLLREKKGSYQDCGHKWLLESQRAAQLGN